MTYVSTTEQLFLLNHNITKNLMKKARMGLTLLEI